MRQCVVMDAHVKLHIVQHQSLGNKNMEMPTFNKMMDSENLAVKIFSETCCNGCTCQSSKDHITEEFVMDEIDFDQ